MVATISVVESSQPSRLLDAAGAMAASAASLNAQIAEQRRQLDALRTHWQGEASTAAIAKGEADLTVQQAVFGKLTNFAAALRYGGTNLDALRSQILAMAAQATALGGRVNDDGTVIGNLRYSVMTPRLAGAYTASLKAMLSMFTAVDAATATALQTGGPVRRRHLLPTSTGPRTTSTGAVGTAIPRGPTSIRTLSGTATSWRR